MGVCTARTYRNVGESCNIIQYNNGTCNAGLYCTGNFTVTAGVCATLKNLGDACAEDKECKGKSSKVKCIGSTKKCTALRSVGAGGTPPEADVKWCQFGLFLDSGKCQSSVVCTKDADCEYDDYSDLAVCNPDSATAGCKSGGKGKCAVLTPSCASVINDYYADGMGDNTKDIKADCCIDSVTGFLGATYRAAYQCSKANEAPSAKGGAASSFLATSVVFVALVAGFFAL